MTRLTSYDIQLIVLKVNMTIGLISLLTPDGVTRGEEVTPSLALSLGLNVDGRHPRIRIYDGGRP